MDSTDAVNILKSCTKQLENMTDEEFEKMEIERNIDDNKYSNELYSQSGIQLVLPGTSEYKKKLGEGSTMTDTCKMIRGLRVNNF
jgi:hypothetical protein